MELTSVNMLNYLVELFWSLPLRLLLPLCPSKWKLGTYVILHNATVRLQVLLSLKSYRCIV